MTLSIQIPAKGQLKGTCGWVKNKLENASVKIANTKSGEIAIWAKLEGEESYTMIARMDDENTDIGYQEKVIDSVNYVFLYPKGNYLQQKHGYFGAGLTAAAENYVDKFIDMCVDALSDFIEADEQLDFDLQIVKK